MNKAMKDHEEEQLRASLKQIETSIVPDVQFEADRIRNLKR